MRIAIAFAVGYIFVGASTHAMTGSWLVTLVSVGAHIASSVMVLWVAYTVFNRQEQADEQEDQYMAGNRMSDETPLR